MVLKLCMHCHLRVFKFKTCNTKVTITLTVPDIIFIHGSITLFQNVLDSFRSKYVLYLTEKSDLNHLSKGMSCFTEGLVFS